MRFLYVKCRVIDIPLQKFLALTRKQKIQVYGITDSDEGINFSVCFYETGRLRKLCREHRIKLEITSHSIIKKISRILSARAGLLTGAAVCAAVILFLENYVVSIEVLTDDENIRQSVTDILRDRGIRAGTYIPDIDFRETERYLKQRADGISWAGISVTDSTIIVDVVENIPEPESAYGRMPSNLIASHSGVIEEAEIYDGEIVKVLGSGVVKGDILVKGTLDRRRTVQKDGQYVTEDYKKYVRSIGTIKGTYTETQVFEQPYTDTRLVSSPKSDKKRYLKIFSFDMPLFFRKPDSVCIEEEKYTPLKIFDDETPVGIKSVTYTPYSFDTVIYTKKQAKAIAAKKRDDYEKNFLSDCEIKGRKTSVEYMDDRVRLTVKYKIFGVMSEESQFFVEKE